MEDLSVLVNLAATETERAILFALLLIGLADRVLKGRVITFIDYILQNSKLVLSTILGQLKREVVETLAAVPPPTPAAKMVVAWGYVTVAVIISAYLFIQAMLTLVLIVTTNTVEHTSIANVVLAGILMSVLLIGAYYYRADAHKIARDNNLI